MGRSPCCAKDGMNRGAWTAIEDKILKEYIKVHGEGRWRNLPKKAGLKRCGKSCRLRWLNYLRPDIKRGNISQDEEELIIRLHKLLGNRWSLIAGRLPGRTDNEIKNYWNTNLGKKVHDHHKSASTYRHSNRYSNEKDKKKSDTASSAMPKMESQPKNGLHVVRTKAGRCSKVFISPLPHKPEPSGNNIVAKQPMVKDTSIVEPIELGSYDGIASFVPEEDHPSDFMLNVNMGELCLADLLNSDFSCLGDSNDRNYSSNDLSPSSDGPLLFSKMLENWPGNDDVQPNVASNHQAFSAFLDSGEDWLAESL